jgi:hypothetical protein
MFVHPRFNYLFAFMRWPVAVVICVYLRLGFLFVSIRG